MPLDIASLIAPLPGKSAGKRLPAFVPDKGLDQRKLKQYREDVDPAREKREAEELYQDDLKLLNSEISRISLLEPKRPQWQTIVDDGVKYLKEQEKDLQVALAMVELLTMLNGFAGLREGIRLIRGLCETCWDTMHPVIDDPTNPDDVDSRVSMFKFLDDEEKPPYFPNTVRSLPLLPPSGETLEISYRNCQPRRSLQKELPPLVSTEQFRTTVLTAKQEAIEKLKSSLNDLNESLDDLRGLVEFIDAKLDKSLAPAVQAPGFVSLQPAMMNCQMTIEQILKLRDPDSSAQPGGESQSGSGLAEGSAPGDRRGGTTLGSIYSREDVYVRLQELAALLERFDPHSPVPYLVRRAVEMRELRFPDLVDQLTSPRGVLDFIRQPIQVEQPPSES